MDLTPAWKYSFHVQQLTSTELLDYSGSTTSTDYVEHKNLYFFHFNHLSTKDIKKNRFSSADLVVLDYSRHEKKRKEFPFYYLENLSFLFYYLSLKFADFPTYEGH